MSLAEQLPMLWTSSQRHEGRWTITTPCAVVHVGRFAGETLRAPGRASGPARTSSTLHRTRRW